MKFNFNDAQPVLFFEVLIAQCQNSIKYILLRSLSAAMFTWPCKTNFTTVPDPLKLQILLEDQTATELLFQSYAATTTIDCMTWLACISHYVRGHVHKTGHNYNGTSSSRSIHQSHPGWLSKRFGREEQWGLGTRQDRLVSKKINSRDAYPLKSARHK